MPFFFVSPENIDRKNKSITLSNDEARHIIKSLRHKENDEIIISDGIKNKYIAKIKKIKDNFIYCDILEIIDVSTKSSNIKISLAQALLKKNKMDFVIQKATELGIHDIIPFTSSRTIPIIGNKNTIKKRERWQKIAFEASKQSERVKVPKVHPIIPIEKLLQQIYYYDLPMVFWEKEKNHSIKDLLKNSKEIENIIYFVGPEGGFSESEIESFQEANTLTVSLGQTIIKSETAAIFALSVLNYHFFMD